MRRWVTGMEVRPVGIILSIREFITAVVFLALTLALVVGFWVTGVKVSPMCVVFGISKLVTTVVLLSLALALVVAGFEVTACKGGD